MYPPFQSWVDCDTRLIFKAGLNSEFSFTFLNKAKESSLLNYLLVVS